MKIFTPLFQAIIAFCAVFGIWFGIANYLLDAKIDPIKTEITRVEKTINDKLDQVLSELKNHTHTQDQIKQAKK